MAISISFGKHHGFSGEESCFVFFSFFSMRKGPFPEVGRADTPADPHTAETVS